MLFPDKQTKFSYNLGQKIGVKVQFYFSHKLNHLIKMENQFSSDMRINKSTIIGKKSIKKCFNQFNLHTIFSKVLKVLQPF